MRVFRRGKVWHYDFSIEGKRFRDSCDTEVESEARRVANEAHAREWKRLKEGVVERRTWVEATKRYLEEHQDLKTYDNYKSQSEWWTEQFKGKGITYIDQMHPDRIKEIRDAEIKRPKQRGGGKRSPADVNRKIAYLRAVVNAVYREYRWISGEPPLYRMLPGEVERDTALAPPEVLQLAKALPEPYGKMAMFAVATGLRRKNVLRLRWEYVDLGARMVRLPHQIMKNGKALRLPLNSMAVEILREQWGKSEEWVFVKDNGKPASEIPSKMWRRVMEDAGLAGLRWHDLRHTWATILGESGVPKQEIQRLGGWKDSRMVERYSNLSVSHLSTAAETVSSAFNGTNTAQSGLRKVG